MSSIPSAPPAPAGTANQNSSGTKSPATDPLTSKETFLKLLVAQIKNQDPTNPTDATQFVGQLTQYSELEQLIEINTGLQKVEATPSAPSTGTPKT
jgi:flagellar basal-body rod modification protein FlgD